MTLGGRRDMSKHLRAVPLIKVACVAAAVVVVGVGSGLYFSSRGSDNSVSVGGVGLTVDPNASGYEAEETAETASAPGVTIPGWGSLTIPADTTDITVDFYNPESNEGYYDLTFELQLPDDSEQGYEVLYTSGLVEPGLHIQHITLSHGLSEGTYHAVIHVQPYKQDEDHTPTNNADMETELIVK
jgi:hypothetical protein